MTFSSAKKPKSIETLHDILFLAKSGENMENDIIQEVRNSLVKCSTGGERINHWLANNTRHYGANNEAQ